MARKAAPKAVSALASFDMPVPKDHENVSYRKIDNGYLVNRDGVKSGKRFSAEFYTNRAPRVAVKPNRRSK